MSMSFGISEKSLQWFDSYLKDRAQSVFLSGYTTTPQKLTTGVPQGSVLWLLLFTLYTADIGIVIKAQSDRDILRSKIISCIGDVAQWMALNRLKLNPSKSDFL